MSQMGRYLLGTSGSPITTITGNNGIPVPPDAMGNIDLLGSGTITVTGNAATHTLTISISGSVADSFPTDSGTATPVAGVLNVLGGTAGRDINTSGAGNTIHIDLNNIITVGDLAVVTAGVPAIVLTSGDLTLSGIGANAAGNINLPNTSTDGRQGEIKIGGTRWISNAGVSNSFIGRLSGTTTVTGTDNTSLGALTLGAITTGSFNTALGSLSGGSITTGQDLTAVGYNALSLATGNNNTALGSLTLSAILTGTNLIGIGFNAGTAYVGAESSNIVIGNIGVVAESNVIRIGTTGGAAGQQNKCFVAGINGVNVGSVASVVSINGDQLGTTTITAGANITITPGANTITIASTATGILTYTNVNTTPYVVLAADEYLSVDCSGGPITIQLPNTTTTGRTIIIKDRTGNANINNISVTTVGGVVTIDTVATYTMNTQFSAINVIFNGTNYEIY